MPPILAFRAALSRAVRSESERDPRGADRAEERRVAAGRVGGGAARRRARGALLCLNL